jgi:hypothetical protein
MGAWLKHYGTFLSSEKGQGDINLLYNSVCQADGRISSRYKSTRNKLVKRCSTLFTRLQNCYVHGGAQFACEFLVSATFDPFKDLPPKAKHMSECQADWLVAAEAGAGGAGGAGAGAEALAEAKSAYGLGLKLRLAETQLSVLCQKFADFRESSLATLIEFSKLGDEHAALEAQVVRLKQMDYTAFQSIVKDGKLHRDSVKDGTITRLQSEVAALVGLHGIHKKAAEEDLQAESAKRQKVEETLGGALSEVQRQVKLKKVQQRKTSFQRQAAATAHSGNYEPALMLMRVIILVNAVFNPLYFTFILL